MLLNQYIRKERDWINRRANIFKKGIGLKLNIINKMSNGDKFLKQKGKKLTFAEPSQTKEH